MIIDTLLLTANRIAKLPAWTVTAIIVLTSFIEGFILGFFSIIIASGMYIFMSNPYNKPANYSFAIGACLGCICFIMLLAGMFTWIF